MQDCKGCPLYADTTQAVFGEGARGARIVLVGEQPGDQEDKQGHPFVGPAGRVLWRCLDEAGIGRDSVFVTNAVKHFKHEDRGKRRLHKKPSTAEVEACHPWVDAELRAVGGRVIVALGATAARSLFGRTMPIAASRGRTLAGRRSAGDRHLPPVGSPARRRGSGGDPGGTRRGFASCPSPGRRRRVGGGQLTVVRQGLPPKPQVMSGMQSDVASTVTDAFAPLRSSLNRTHVVLFVSSDSSQRFSGSASCQRV